MSVSPSPLDSVSMSLWGHKHLFYSSQLILSLRLFQPWPLRALLDWFLCLFDILLSFFLALPYFQLSYDTLGLSYIFLSLTLTPFIGRCCLATKIWALGILIAIVLTIGFALPIGSLSLQSYEIHIHMSIHMLI